MSLEAQGRTTEPKITVQRKKNCSETALKKVRLRVVSADAQTLTNQPKITVQRKKTALKLL